MVPPPLFADLGKPARDVFSRGYNFGHIKLDTTTRSGDIEFKTNCLQNIGSGKLFGGIDVKYKIPAQNMTLAERWNTDNTLSTEIVIDNKLLKGLKLILETAYAPYVGKRSGKVKAEFKHDAISLNGDVNIDSTGGPIFNVGGVVGYNNFFVGAHTGFDPAKTKLTHSNFGVAFDKGEFGIHALINNGNEYGGNLYHRVNNQLEMAANLNWTGGEQATRFGVAAKYDVDRDTVFRGKINNASQLGVGLTHTLKPGLKFTVSALINLPNFSEGGHKLGFGIEYDAPVRKN
jgi:hypothetical protein